MNISNEPVERNYDYSRPLDIHKSSNHPGANIFVNEIYEKYFKPYYDNQSKSKVNHSIRKKHLKLVLLDLYVAWCSDPALHIGIHMSKNSYTNGQVSIRGKSRYNKLNIKDSLIPIVKRLRELGFIGFKLGTNLPRLKRISRIWAEGKLVSLFQKVLFNSFDVSYRSDTEVIILRTKNKKLIEYKQTNTSDAMRQVVQDYNEILRRTFVDIPGYDKPEIIMSTKSMRKPYKDIKVRLTQDSKFVCRMFNNGSLSLGGKFIGGWWTRVGEEFRKQIYINNEPTIEIDYSSIHVVLAYSQIKIDYWSTTDQDPYEVVKLPIIDDPEASHMEIEPDHRRHVIKSLFLLSIHAKNETEAFQAFTSEWDYTEYPYKGVFKHKYLKQLLDNIRTAHPAISNMIASGAEIELMNINSQIVEYILKNFIKRDIPILTVHDSFIIELSQYNLLDRFMREAVIAITGLKYMKVKWNKDLTTGELKNTAAGWTNLDANNQIKKTQNFNDKVFHDGYDSRWEKHKKYFSIEDGHY